MIAREDKLLQKMTKQRKADEDTVIPLFLWNYVQKIWMIQEELHGYLNSFRNHTTKNFTSQLKMYQNGEVLDQELLKEKFIGFWGHDSEECPQINFQLALRYIKNGREDQLLNFDYFSGVLTGRNCNMIQQFLDLK